MVRFFIGVVHDVLEEHCITFNISDWAEDIGQPPPTATPATRLSRYPEEGDEVLIVQPDSRFEIFFYFITPEYSEGTDQSNYVISLDYGVTGEGSAYVRIRKDSDGKYHIEANDNQGTNLQLTENLIEATIDFGGAKSEFSITNKTLDLSLNDGVKVLMSGEGKTLDITSGTSTIKMTNSDVTINGHLKVTV